MADLDIRIIGRTGRITLMRPAALNALDHAMTLAIAQALDQWRDGRDVDMALVDSSSVRAFCAGGDIAALYHKGRAGDFDAGRRYWGDEYRLNVKIATMSIPYVAIMDGIVMGGGAGISSHGSHRIVTDRSVVAMPECRIGLVPDVGCSLLLARAPGALGMFLALTGWRMDAGDAIAAGFADVMVDGDNVEALKGALEESGDPGVIARFIRPHEAGALEAHRAAIEAHFSHSSALACLHSLEGDDSPFAQKAAAMMRHASPLALATTFELVRQARGLATVADAVRVEYRAVCRCLAEGDFLEGVRAAIIDKDHRPAWRQPRLEAVDPAMTAAMLAPLGADELVLPE